MAQPATMAQRNDLRRTSLDAFTLRSLGARRRAAFGRGRLRTGAPKPDPVTLARPRTLPRPLQPARTHGVDLVL